MKNLIKSIILNTFQRQIYKNYFTTEQKPVPTHLFFNLSEGTHRNSVLRFASNYRYLFRFCAGDIFKNAF